MRTPAASLASSRAGITLTEILLGIMILGVGLVSLATLFPIGLLRLRAAQRLSRSTYLVESAAADVAARGLLNPNSFHYADLLNVSNGFSMWYPAGNPLGGNPPGTNWYDPLVQDTPSYGVDPYDTADNGTNLNLMGVGVSVPSSGGYGLPFAYDPLWRYQTGVYLTPQTPASVPEARFGCGNPSVGLSFLRNDPSDGNLASAYGLQRLTNFNRLSYVNGAGVTITVMPQAIQVPSIFVSPEDVVWQEPTNANYWQAFTTPPGNPGFTPLGAPSPIVADLSISKDNAGNYTYQPVNDWRFSWMVTAQQTNVPANAGSQFPAANGATFDGNIVIFENRPFAIDPNTGVVAGETVVEAVYGPSQKVMPAVLDPVHNVLSTTYGYGVGADRTVLLRWFATQPDPVVKVGDWICDVTYERTAAMVLSRFYAPGPPTPSGYGNQLNNGEWDNLPAQRCFWYQVQKVTPAEFDPVLGNTYRIMNVYVNRKLEARTLLRIATGQPAVLNAVLICPNVVNVVPQTFLVR